MCGAAATGDDATEFCGPCIRSRVSLLIHFVGLWYGVSGSISLSSLGLCTCSLAVSVILVQHFGCGLILQELYAFFEVGGLGYSSMSLAGTSPSNALAVVEVIKYQQLLP